MAEVVLDLPEGAELAFRAGAFVQVTVPAYRMSYREIDVAPEHRAAWERFGLRELSAGTPEPVTRAYSLANRPRDRGRLVLDVRLSLPPPGTGYPPGIASSYLFGVKPGETIEVAGPYGSFAVRDSEREMIFIGGGAGMAPLRAMIFDQLERVRTRRTISFWYGARGRADLFYGEELDALQREHDNFSWTVALSDAAPEDAWDGPTGFIHQVVRTRHLQTHPAPDQCEYYLCGPPLMTHAVLAMLDELGVPRERIFNDDFGT
jgi:Na+-transporting NADH:ubiquinone oxidoreductase subunit F